MRRQRNGSDDGEAGNGARGRRMGLGERDDGEEDTGNGVRERRIGVGGRDSGGPIVRIYSEAKIPFIFLFGTVGPCTKL